MWPVGSRTQTEAAAFLVTHEFFEEAYLRGAIPGGILFVF